MRRKKKSNGTDIGSILLFTLLSFVGTGMIGVGATNTNEYSPIFIIVGAIIVVIFLSLGFFFNLPIVKGKRGEMKVGRIIKRIAKKYNGKVINDVIVQDSESGLTSQIDHILFLRTGIYVIETKNYTGRIYGEAKERKWTQVLKYGQVKNTLYNPLMQNYTHIRRLRNALGINKGIISCVVFVRGNTQYIDANNVFSPRELKSYILEAINNEQEKFNSVELENAYIKINEFKENPIETNKEHVQKIKENKKKIENNICPRCGGELVLRKNKSGNEFYGCSSYPKCTFTKEID